MNILAISGSRNEEGQTATAMKSLLEGVVCGDSTFSSIYLPKMNIERCRQCDDDGWGICRSEGECIIEDDFAHVVNEIRNHDAVVFATPVYFSDLSESMKALLDRLRRININEKGKEGIAGKPAVGICVAGGGGGGAPQCCLNLERTLRTCGFDLVDTIAVRRQNLELKKEVLKTVGKWLVTN